MNEPRRISTAGAWLGAFVATWAAATTTWHVAWLVATSFAPAFVNRAADAAYDQSAAVDPSFARLLDLTLVAARRLAAYSRVADASAVLIGFALFAAAFALVRGSDVGRRAARFLLALKLAHSLASAVWLAALWTADPDGLGRRMDALLAEAARQAPTGTRAGDVVERFAAWTHGAPAFFAAAVVAGVGASAVSFWLAGRPFAREWCDARGRPPVATRAGAG